MFKVSKFVVPHPFVMFTLTTIVKIINFFVGKQIVKNTLVI